jgi:thioredoxin-like negative regulator of GroEL
MSAELLPPEAFQGARLLRDGPWVVAFLADWCPFCREFRPKFEALDGESAFRTGIADLTDDESPLWEEFQIEVVPALVVFSNGRPVHRHQSDPGVGLPSNALARARAAALASGR